MRGCSLWAISFAQAGDLRKRVRMHIRKTTAVQNAPSHLSASCLKHHISVHTGGKPSNCSICTYRAFFPQQYQKQT